MKKIFLIFSILCLLYGCSTTKDVYTSDGGLAHKINCSGQFVNWDGCYAKAGDLCKEKGYEILDKYEYKYDIPFNPGQTDTGRKLTIRCK